MRGVEDGKGRDREGWQRLTRVVRRLAYGEVDAVEELNDLVVGAGVSAEVSETAENIGLLLVKMEGKEFMLSAAEETQARLHALNELKNRHLGIAAHDLRNPLGTIRGLARFLTRPDVSDERKQSFARSIVGISEEMLSLVENLLDVAVIESGRLELDLTEGNLAALLRDRVERARVAVAGKEIDFEVETAEVPDTNFDATRMGQVLDNLISNAVKFSPPRSRVSLRCRRDGTSIVLEVSDEGAGIADEELPAIFDPYGRSAARPTGGEKSTGLGLSIVKPILEAHGGDISVESLLGEGTTFTIRMPAEPVDP